MESPCACARLVYTKRAIPTSQKRDVGHPGTLAPLRMTNWSLNPKRFLANLKEA